ncbi:hypothetical protein NB694_000569 [Pantoea ananatis]|uniref:hypothetical protein n=1 Tax=Pantoea ananas TaxID=553 RepID=UPI0021F7FD10|nr:hypothetical protein [Pantoea ananatis]MCW0310769.1 hypothetical protein [Pantoea ananatis]
MQKDDEASSNIKGLIGLPLIVITALLMIMALTSVSSGTFIFALTGGALILISWAMWLICELVASVWERRWIDVAKVISLPFIFAGLVFLSVTEFNYIKLFLIYPSYYPLFDIAQYYTHQPVIIKWMSLMRDLPISSMHLKVSGKPGAFLTAVQKNVIPSLVSWPNR